MDVIGPDPLRIVLIITAVVALGLLVLLWLKCVRRKTPKSRQGSGKKRKGRSRGHPYPGRSKHGDYGDEENLIGQSFPKRPRPAHTSSRQSFI